MGKEAERKMPDFQVAFEDIDAFVNAINAGKSGKIGNAFLPESISQIECRAEVDTNKFNLHAALFTRTKNPLYNMRESPLPFKKQGNNYVFEGPDGSGFVVTTSQMNDNTPFIQITNSYGWDARGRKVELLKLPDKNPEVIRKNALFFCNVINSIVALVDGHLPNTKLTLSVPGKIEISDNFEDLKGAVDIEASETKFDEIGGQDKARQEIESLTYALTNPAVYKKWGTRPPKGILLYGPPGTGKTLLAKALASQARAEFIHVKASDVGTKWFGESEKLVQRIFDTANSRKGNTIIFFDELDAIAPSRNSLSADSGANQATIRIISTLMENMDGLSSSSKVFVVAATNRPDSIDVALRRPGRLDRIVEVPLPDELGRKQIFAIHMSKTNKIAERELFNAIDLNMLASKSDNFSGADIAEIIRRTLEAKLRLEITGKNPELVNTEDILLQVLNYEHNKKV